MSLKKEKTCQVSLMNLFDEIYFVLLLPYLVWVYFFRPWVRRLLNLIPGISISKRSYLDEYFYNN